LTILADYSCDTYGVNAYGQCAATANTGGLAGTGYNIIIPVAFGLALIIASAMWLFKVYRRNKKVKSQLS
jgi:hypothetical protein